jgi:hypothetical protein
MVLQFVYYPVCHQAQQYEGSGFCCLVLDIMALVVFVMGLA